VKPNVRMIARGGRFPSEKSQPLCARSSPGPESSTATSARPDWSCANTPLAVSGIYHRLHPVHDEIQHDPLKLDSIAHDGAEIGGQGGSDTHVMAAELVAHEGDHLLNHSVHFQQNHLERGLPRQGADALDDIAGAVAAPDDSRRRLPRFLDIHPVRFSTSWRLLQNAATVLTMASVFPQPAGDSMYPDEARASAS
jgi:hypothetical protein